MHMRGIILKMRTDNLYKMIVGLHGALTGTETSELFALLRGVHPKVIPKLCQKLAIDFKFMKHLNKRTGQYSGGNKIKPSTAIVMLGNPAIIY